MGEQVARRTTRIAQVVKTIALLDTRLEVPGVSLGILVSFYPDVMAAFAANDAFQKAEASGRHIRTKKIGSTSASPSSRRTWSKANEREVTGGARLCPPIFSFADRTSPRMGTNSRGAIRVKHVAKLPL